jgi:hypothetical protein
VKMLLRTMTLNSSRETGVPTSNKEYGKLRETFSYFVVLEKPCHGVDESPLSQWISTFLWNPGQQHCLTEELKRSVCKVTGSYRTH